MKSDLAINSTYTNSFEPSKAAQANPDISRKINASFERVVHQIEQLESPLRVIETSFEWSRLIESIEHYSDSALLFLSTAAQPYQIITLINDVKKVAFRSISEDKPLMIKPAELSALGFSMISRCCRTLNWLQNLGVITPAVAAAWRISFIGSFCSLMSSSVELGDNVVHYSSAFRLAKAFLNFTTSALAVYVLLQFSVQLHILSLMLTTGTLFLSAVTTIYQI